MSRFYVCWMDAMALLTLFGKILLSSIHSSILRAILRVKLQVALHDM